MIGPSEKAANSRSPVRLIGIAVSVICLGLFFYWVPLREVVEAAKGADAVWLVIAALFTAANIALRGTRWSLLLARPDWLTMVRASQISAVGLALNAVLPGKVGEFVRIGLAARVLAVRLGRAAMASALERLMDLIVLSLAGAAFINLLLQAPGSIPDQYKVQLTSLVISLSIASALGIVFMFLANYDRIGIILRKRIGSMITSRRWRHRFIRLSLDVRQGATALRDPGIAIIVIFTTAVVWALLGVVVYLVGLAITGVECSIAAAMGFAVIMTLVSALPSAPGAWGVYEAVGILLGQAIVSHDSMSALAAFVILTHVVQYIPVLVVGLLSWHTLPGEGRRESLDLRR